MPELRVHYMTVGEPSGQPVLILHGTTQSGPALLSPAFAGELFGAGQVPADDRRTGVAPHTSGAWQFNGRHADVDLGRRVSRLHGRTGADGLPAQRDVEP